MIKTSFVAVAMSSALALLTVDASAAGTTKNAPRIDAAPVAAAVPIPLPSTEIQTILVKNALIGLNQANLANDYSVFLKNTSVPFQRANMGDKLSNSFKAFRDNRIDLSPIVLFTPRWKSAPAYQNGALHLIGVIPSSPLQTSFDMLFVPEGGRWRIAGLSVGLEPAATATQPASR